MLDIIFTNSILYYERNYSTDSSQRYITKHGQRKGHTALIVLDLSATFDTIDYPVLGRLSDCSGVSYN